MTLVGVIASVLDVHGGGTGTVELQGARFQPASSVKRRRKVPVFLHPMAVTLGAVAVSASATNTILETPGSSDATIHTITSNAPLSLINVGVNSIEASGSLRLTEILRGCPYEPRATANFRSTALLL